MSDTVDNCKDTKAIWEHLRSVNSGTNLPTNQIPTELVINNECIIDSTKAAPKLNEFFASIAEQFEMNNFEISHTDGNKIKTFVHYANMSGQYTAIFHGYKNDYFQMKNYNIFFALNVDCEQK